MIRGSDVIDPCPISVAADMMVMVPSGAIDTHGLNALPVRSAATLAARATLPDRANAKVRPAAPTMICRRDNARRDGRMCVVMASGLLRGALDRAHDPPVRAAAAKVGAHVLDDLGAGRIGI